MRALALILALTGCSNLECGIGTHEEAGECVPNVLTRCAEGTVYERGWCVVEDAGRSGDADGPDATNPEGDGQEGG